MGSIGQAIFGGSRSKQKSSSWNQAYPFLQQQFGGMTGHAGGGADAIAAMLGVGGDASTQDAAFDRFRDASGYNFLFNEGQRAVTSSNAAKGLLNSGSTLTALQNRGQQLASTSMGDYLDRLRGLSGLGLQAGGLLAGAGSRSESSGKSSTKPGISSFLGALMSGGAGG